MTIEQRLRRASYAVPVNTKWQHKKGGRYVVVGHALSTETDEILVLYRRIGGPDFDAENEALNIFARPERMWFEENRFVHLT